VKVAELRRPHSSSPKQSIQCSATGCWSSQTSSLHWRYHQICHGDLFLDSRTSCRSGRKRSTSVEWTQAVKHRNSWSSCLARPKRHLAGGTSSIFSCGFSTCRKSHGRRGWRRSHSFHAQQSKQHKLVLSLWDASSLHTCYKEKSWWHQTSKGFVWRL